jgi:hypothetical protein
MFRNLVALELEFNLLIITTILGWGRLTEVGSVSGWFTRTIGQQSRSGYEAEAHKVIREVIRSKPWLNNNSRGFCVCRISESSV